MIRVQVNLGQNSCSACVATLCLRCGGVMHWTRRQTCTHPLYLSLFHKFKMNIFSTLHKLICLLLLPQCCVSSLWSQIQTIKQTETHHFIMLMVDCTSQQREPVMFWLNQKANGNRSETFGLVFLADVLLVLKCSLCGTRVIETDTQGSYNFLRLFKCRLKWNLRLTSQ